MNHDYKLKIMMIIEDASRDHRPLKSISADVLLRRLQMSFQDGLCNVVHVLRFARPAPFESGCCGWVGLCARGQSLL